LGITTSTGGDDHIAIHTTRVIHNGSVDHNGGGINFSLTTSGGQRTVSQGEGAGAGDGLIEGEGTEAVSKGDIKGFIDHHSTQRSGATNNTLESDVAGSSGEGQILSAIHCGGEEDVAIG